MNAGLGVTLNFDANSVEPNVAFDPIPSGWYPCIIEESKMEPTKAGDGQMLALTMKVLDGEFKGRKLFDRLNLQNPNPATVEIAYKTLSAISRACGVMQVANSQQLHNIPIWVKAKYVGKETNQQTGQTYDPKNDVKGYDHISQQHEIPTSANAGGATAGGVAGAPQGTPPWAAQQAAAPAPGAQQQYAPAPGQQAAPAPTYAPPVQQVEVGGAQQPWQQPGAQAAPAPQAAATGAPPWQATAEAAAAAAPAPAPAPAPVAAAPAPPAPVTTGPQMLPGATTTYEEYRKAGWTDDMLISNGLMAAPVAAAPAPHVASGAPAPATGAGGPRPPWATT